MPAGKLLNYYKEGLVEAGCDEAGRGCLAGPVFAAAVILPNNFTHPLLNDSKQVTENNRNILRYEIEINALAFAVACCTPDEIDKINILNASLLAMHRALDQLTTIPDHILVDGNQFKAYKKIPHTCIIKGDGKYKSIAAASILAKTYRDEYMLSIADEFPVYLWHKNKGYPTLEHRIAVQKYGICTYHRKSFNSDVNQLKLTFSDDYKS
jgi:ribonuclease HII